MGPAPVPNDVGDPSFTSCPMDIDAEAFVDAGFTANPFPGSPNMDAGSLTLPHTVPPTHDEIEASLASLRAQLQTLALNDAARRLEIDELRQAGQATSSRLDDTDLRVKEVEADTTRTKNQMAEVLAQLSDMMRYISSSQHMTPASSRQVSAMQCYTNIPSFNMHHLAEDPFTDLISNPPSIRPPGAFQSASHSAPALPPLANRPLTRRVAAIAGPSEAPVAHRTASSMFPQSQVTSSARHAKNPRAASDSPPKGNRKGKARGKGKGKARARAGGKGKGHGKVEDADDCMDDPADAEEDHDFEDPECEDQPEL